MIINVDLEMMERLEREIEGKDIYEVRNIVPRVLREGGFKLVYQYQFKKAGVLDRPVERYVYSDNYNLIIVDFGQEYEQVDESYNPYYYLNIQVVDGDVSYIYKEFD